MCVPCWSGNQSPADLRALEQSYKGVLSAFPSKRKWLGTSCSPHATGTARQEAVLTTSALSLGLHQFHGTKTVCLSHKYHQKFSKN